VKSIKPKKLILNGDIVDVWQFKKKYWPKTHMKVVKHIINLASKDTEVIYITGNHDEILRKFDGLQLGKFSIVNKYECTLEGAKTWFFHGDVFDIVIQNSKWLAVLGSVSYDLLIRLNQVINKLRKYAGKPKSSLSKSIKNNVKKAVSYINSFEETAARVAIPMGFSHIVCGHIHQPEQRIISIDNEHIQYLNSGDWIENLTSLEYNHGKWSIYRYNDTDYTNDDDTTEAHEEITELNNKDLFKKMYQEFFL
jgi:UDP-2,3-diacylglucosamine pyrophosphatase LpxH